MLGNDVNDEKLLIIVIVHAIILKFGSIWLDLVSTMATCHSRLIDKLFSSISIISLRHIMPEILINGSIANHTIIFKFQALEHVMVYNWLSDSSSGLYKVCLDKSKFTLTLDLMMSKCDLKNDTMNNINDNHENEVSKFWKIVKDGFALPLTYLKEK